MPIFAIVDCNSFFCSCERLINPAIKGKPVIVLSNNDGMVVARSKEAKALGVNWDAFHLIRDKVRHYDIKAFSSNYPLYSEVSGRVMTVLKEFAPLVEVYSCDEAFLDLTGMQNLEQYGQVIRNTILWQCGIPVSIGIARTKTLAKLANHIAKRSDKLKTGVLSLVDSPYMEDALKRVDVRDVWGVGSRWSERLKAQGIKTAYDLAKTDKKMLLKRYNVVLTRTALELDGVFCLPLQLDSPISKTIVSSMSFGKLVTDFESLRQVISTYAAGSAAKMRQERLTCMAVIVFLETNRFIDEPQYYPSIEVPLPYATANTGEIIQAATTALEAIYQEGYRYNKGGVMVVGLTPEAGTQSNLFERYDRERVMHLMDALDQVNAVYGPGTLRYGAQGFKNAAWKTRQNFLSSNSEGKMSDYQKIKRICELGQNTALYRSL